MYADPSFFCLFASVNWIRSYDLVLLERMKMRHLIILIAGVLCFGSCLKEIEPTEPDSDKFGLEVSEQTQQFILNSRDTSYSVEDPDLKLYFNDVPVDLKDIRIRGKSALRFRKTCL